MKSSNALLDTRNRSLLLLFVLFEFLQLLLLECGWLGVLEVHFVGGQLLVGVGESLKFTIDGLTIEGVKENFLFTTSVLGNSGLSSVDAAWSYNVFKDSSMHSLQGPGTGSHLSWVLDL